MSSFQVNRQVPFERSVTTPWFDGLRPNREVTMQVYETSQQVRR